jgi:hypothetical protein
MSNFKCGLRRFDGHGTSSSCSPKTPVAKEVESAYSKMMRQREQQDRGEYTRTTEYRPVRDEPKVVVPDQPICKGLPGVTVAAEPQLNSRFLISDNLSIDNKGLPPPSGGGVLPGVNRFLTYSLSDASPNKNTE